MEEYLIAIKNHYLNVRGGKKIKVLTSGKKYKRVGYLLGYAIVINDIDLSAYYRIGLFTNVANSRSNKLESLGI